MLDYTDARRQMVERQVAGRGVRDERVLAAMRAVPREAFLAGGMSEFAYEDAPLPIEAGQTISQPYIVALMTEAAALGPQDRVLEIGTGSGYAAAVLSRLCRQVFTVERHAELADLARDRLHRLHCDNVVVRTGDGTRGWPEEAPFDAIIATAGGPAIPGTLRAQLAIGGRLIMPIGEEMRRQHLVKLVRHGQDDYSEEDLGDVLFVPLIGEHGWRDDAAAHRPDPPVARTLPQRIAQAAEPLPTPEDPAFGSAFDRFRHARVVLLGEASHGTSEFYRARAAITRRLVGEHGFTIVAAEADWPDAATIDRHVRLKPSDPGQRPPFRRFPTWMWRNTDVDAFTRWLRRHNAALPAAARAGFYGLDLYNLSASTRAVIDYLDRVDPEAAAVARRRYGCLTPWQNDPQAYGRMALSEGYAPCEEAVVRMLAEICARELDFAAADPDSFLDASQNARLVRDAERYYRAMFYGAAESWNLRDRHMFETLCHVLDAKGPSAKAVVWAHNSHIGDARKTEMGRVRGELNIGQLCRERFGADAALIGFGTHAGTVACASDWDEPMEVKQVSPSRSDSYERLAHDTGVPRFLLDLGAAPALLREALMKERLERFIGVIYRPESERWSHYSACTLPEQFDAYVWFDQTSAVTPIPTPESGGEEETYPFGL
ncbi:protein-L-isoaspartate(D-aspartate) O-methyltransferase [Labrys monachus]|uniref:Protein-L-isoaspartate O-methyltransferase n=1 Tax=Labrys monachus TaxID=217067 RepID=A0ABU0F9U0_9HYPH|nr:protein-L-isoaspartate(D-aspartate) O-methyltransferase [Labrys monachus]MDQ0391387.1 protein-L-isoaspartate(D-aspartate) O-methyltransferase [Labrys monachus]